MQSFGHCAIDEKSGGSLSGNGANRCDGRWEGQAGFPWRDGYSTDPSADRQARGTAKNRELAMTILDTNTVDVIGTLPEQNPAVLSISDHLEWDDAQTGEHLLLLQEKINTYLRYIESGEVYTSFPSAKGRDFAIRIYCKYEPNTEARAFIERATPILRGAGVELEVMIDPERRFTH
ncbi:hypothetical protein J2797_006554 [Paraburkholderia terricola]|uniref:DUF6572 domain-containing protein n=1 Tax=Paraburkholderia terricola TaxID=169427 RepID=UPI0028577A01|nr:DUF6572 domain-containing protein [Paraburkholderia terricola]MDR6496627.1 hypothetical protein [Paraburkholderia terricola]